MNLEFLLYVEWVLNEYNITTPLDLTVAIEEAGWVVDDNSINDGCPFANGECKCDRQDIALTIRDFNVPMVAMKYLTNDPCCFDLNLK